MAMTRPPCTLQLGKTSRRVSELHAHVSEQGKLLCCQRLELYCTQEVAFVRPPA